VGFKTKETYTTGTGQEMVYVHSRDECEGDHCPIHNPSDHPLKDAPTHWRGDRGIMERVCQHGVGHPDPDDIRVRRGWWEGIHGCDGCCEENQKANLQRVLDKPAEHVKIKLEGDFLSYREAWEELRSAIEGVERLYGDDTIKIEYLLSFMDKKEKRLQK
jgi:hypothetical protein